MDDYGFAHPDWAFLAAKSGWNLPDNAQYSEWDSRLVSFADASRLTVDIRRLDSLYPEYPEVSRQITDVCARLLDIFKNERKYLKFLGHRDDKAQDLLDLLQKLLDYAPLDDHFRIILYVALVRLCRISERCPRSFDLRGVTDREDEARSSGRFGDVYDAFYEEHPVCLKSVKVYRERDSQEKFNNRKRLASKAFSREAVVWGQLSHANILPFYGIYFFNDTLSLVSPRMQNGNVHEFLKQRPNANRPQLIYGVVCGMEYLHQNGVAHGDLKCLNVLVSDDEQALITDFGFSYVTDVMGIQGLSSHHASGGTDGFVAPERVGHNTKRRDGPSDVFAFGMLCYEMFGSPSIKATTIFDIHSNIVNHHSMPEYPDEYLVHGLTEDIWALMVTCLSIEPKNRPTATELKRRLPRFRVDYPLSRIIIRPDFKPADGTIRKAFSHLHAL